MAKPTTRSALNTNRRTCLTKWVLLLVLAMMIGLVQGFTSDRSVQRQRFLGASSTSSVSMSSSIPATHEKIAVVTGASKGIGRGIAVELGAAGYTVYCLGRSSRQSSKSSTGSQSTRTVAEGLDVTVESAAEEVTARGGMGYPIPCDLTQDNAIEDILAQVYETHGSLDLLVCAAYETSQVESLRGNFWDQSMKVWDSINHLGLRQVYAACRAAAPLMIETAQTKSTGNNAPLICLVSSFGGKSYTFNVAYGIGKAAVDRMALDMSYQLKSHGVATTSIYPGLVRTEANLQMVEVSLSS